MPAAGLRFGSRPAARAAARATEQYRRTLRQYDPWLPTYDVIVCQDAAADSAGRPGHPHMTGLSGPDRARDGNGDGAAGATGGRPALIDFCHLVVGAVFEAVAASSHRAVERAIMDTYLERAETIESPDELCLRLLESTATELDRGLAPAEQARVLAAAASRLSPPAPTARPLEAALSRLCAVTLVEDYALAPAGSASAWEVFLSRYAPAGDRLVTLPLAVELFRRSPTALAISGVERAGGSTGTWSFRLTTAPEGDPAGLAAVREGAR